MKRHQFRKSTLQIEDDICCLTRTELIELAFKDQLTAIYNKNALIFYLARLKSLPTNELSMLGMIFIDIDHFKFINDHYGHRTGDEVLARTAQTIVDTVRKSDFVCRFGGDEFVVLIRQLESKEHLRLICQKISDKLITCGIETSHGICVCPEDGSDLNDLLDVADTRMYEFKRNKNIKSSSRNAARHISFVQQSPFSPSTTPQEQIAPQSPQQVDISR